MTLKEKLILLFNDISLPYKVVSFLDENFRDEDLLNCIETLSKEIIEVVGESYYYKIKNAISLKNIEKTTQKLEKYNINAIFYTSDKYPQSLKNIENPPYVLYYKGDINLLNSRNIAIVGTRKPTAYGREVTRHFASSLSKAGLVTVSGLAYGLDMEVARSTLDVGGKTIAVLGGGLDQIYPSQNTNLADEILDKGGLLLSLYPPLKRPTKYSFIERNRIISGISLGTIIVEAGESSGTLNTANHAIEQGKELFVVPANIFSSASSGSNRLIQELPETFTSSPEHVLKVLKISYNSKEEKQQRNDNISDIGKQVLNILFEGEKDFDSIQQLLKLDSKSLISLLTRLEINGLIKKLPNNFYSL